MKNPTHQRAAALVAEFGEQAQLLEEVAAAAVELALEPREQPKPWLPGRIVTYSAPGEAI